MNLHRLTSPRVGIGIAEPEEIDRLNILRASLTAMARAVAALPEPVDHALIDGNKAAPLSCDQSMIIKGDARSVYHRQSHARPHYGAGRGPFSGLWPRTA